MRESWIVIVVATSMLFGSGAGALRAEEKMEEPEGDPAPTSTDERLEMAFGAGFVTSPRPYIGAEPRSFPVPVVDLKYDRWFFESIRGGYAFVERADFDARAFTQVRFRGLEPESSPFLTGMEPRRKSLDAGVEMIYRGRPVGFRLAALTDVLGRSNGQEVSAQAVTGAPLGRALVLVGFGPRWLSQNRVDYYYGVRPEEARPDRPAYVGDSTINWDLTISTVYKPTSRWTVFALLTREGLGSAIEESPLVARSAAYSLVASVSYGF